MTLFRLIPAVLAAAVLWTSAVHAQGCGPSNPNCIVPTAPNGTSTNQAASTKFVQNAFAGGSSLALPNTQIFIGGLDGLVHAQVLSGAGDCTMSLANNGVATFTCTKTNGVNFGPFATGANAANLTGTVSVNRFNSGINASGSTYLNGSGTWSAPPSQSNAAQFGIVCDGVTDDGPAFITAFNALAGAPLILPAGTCRIATTAFYNKWLASGTGLLTQPGPKIIGQGRQVTNIEADVANGYAIAINPDWAAANKSLFVLTPGTAGSLASNTYNIVLTVSDPGGNEVFVAQPKTTGVVTGPNGSVAMTLQPVNTGYCYNIYIGTGTPANYATVSGTDAICRPAGAVVITAIGSAHAFPVNKLAIWQETAISDLSIINATATANASGVLWTRVGYSTMSNVYMRGLTGSGLVIPNWNGDGDGSFVVTIDKSKFQAITGWCINAGGNTLEFSNFTVSNSVFDLCGIEPSNMNVNFTMTAITNANPGVVTTASPHTLLFGDQIFIAGVTGMSLPSGLYRACGAVSGSTFSLCNLNGDNVNTTSLGAYTASSGTEQLSWRPPRMQANGNGASLSGAIAYTGLISNFINNGFTQNKNTSIYMTEAGTNDNSTLISNDFENTAGKAVYVASVVNLNMINNECLTTVGLGTTISCVQFGTGLNQGGAQNVTMDGWKIRSDVAGISANGFEQLKGAGGLIYKHTFTVKNAFWQNWVAAVKYFNFGGNSVPLFWARFDGKTGSTCTLADSFNISTCVRNSLGDYTLTFNNPSLDGNYTVSGIGQDIGVASGIMNMVSSSTTSINVRCLGLGGGVQDCNTVSVQGFGNPN